MCDTIQFKTRSEIREMDFPKINGNNQHVKKTIVAADIGYSAIKGVSPNKMFTIPSFVKRAPESLEVFGKADPNDIVLKDNTTGASYFVGRLANKFINESDTQSITDTSLYNRYRYNSESFDILVKTALAVGLLRTGTAPTDEIIVQTGLPSVYKDRDTEKIRAAFAKDYDISLKVGNSNWYHFVFTIKPENVYVLEQPQGTLCSVMFDKSGEFTAQANEIISSDGVLIWDIGFGTEDIFSIRTRHKDDIPHKTYSDTAMRAVFDMVASKAIEAGADVKVFEMQKYLEKGAISYFDPDDDCVKHFSLDGLIQEANSALCKKSIDRLMAEYNRLMDYKYLIVTGGTGESRFEQIKEQISAKNPDIIILPGNLNNPELPFAYSNVVGYYMQRHANVKREQRE